MRDIFVLRLTFFREELRSRDHWSWKLHPANVSTMYLILCATPKRSRRLRMYSCVNKLILRIARNGLVYASIPYRNFFVPEFNTGTYQYIYLYQFSSVTPVTGSQSLFAISIYTISISLTVCPCFTFKKYTGTSKFQFRILILRTLFKTRI
jgi:hypothetical protein